MLVFCCLFQKYAIFLILDYRYPQMTQELIQLARNMDSVDVELLITMARRLRGEAESK